MGAVGSMITVASSATLNGLTPVTLTFTNTAATDQPVTLYAAAVGNLDPADAGNAQGAEAVAESWLEVSDDDGANWHALGFPATFPATFADLPAQTGCYEITVPASGAIEVLARQNVPAGASSTGVVTQTLQYRYRQA